jgi:DNA-binding transcriptional regulator GbsR (MarR family)
MQYTEELPTTTRMAELIEMSKGYISGLLADLVAEGLVFKGKKIGREQPYFLPDTDVSKWYESSNDSSD